MAYPSITLEQIVSSAFIALDVDDSRDELIFKEWAWDALREIGPSRVDRKTKCIPIVNLCAMKPCDYLYGLDMNILDDSNQIYYFQMAESGFLESEQSSKGAFSGLTSTPISTGASIKIAEQKEAFVFSSNSLKAGVTKMDLTYYSYPVDEYGEPLVEEKMKEAIITYIEFRYLKRERRRRVGTRDLPLAEVADAREEWKRQRMAIRGDIKMPDPLSAETIFRRWVSGIPNYKRKSKNSRITRF